MNPFPIRARYVTLLAAAATLSITCLYLYLAYPRGPPIYRDVTPLDTNRTYTRTLVVASFDNGADWIDNLVQAENDLSSAVYNTTTSTKALAYLTYIIDHYFNLDDVTIFTTDRHPPNTPERIQSLEPLSVMQTGFVNLGQDAKVLSLQNGTVPETATVLRAWDDLFPEDPVPSSLVPSAQFAASARQIRQVPLLDWVAYQKWVERVDADVWEYLWEWVFTYDISE